jgi:hypothetical protein
MMWCKVICVKKPAARVKAGAESPANAATGFSGVAKLEKTRLYQTTSGFNCRMVLSRRTGVANAAELPAADDVESRQLRKLMRFQRIAVLSVAKS